MTQAESSSANHDHSPTTTPSSARRRPGEDCTPAERVTRSLLGYGMLAGPFYVVASLIEALLRPGFDLTRHDWSLLALGDLGWIHVVVLILTGLMVIAAAVGVGRELHSQGERATAAWFLGGFGAGMVAAGVFVADPANGFPPGSSAGATPGSSAGATTEISWHGLLHLACGGLGFISLVVACILIAVRFRRAHQTGWFVFSLVTGILFLAAFFGIASGSPSTATVLAFTGGVLLVFTWLLLFSGYLYRLIAERRHAVA